MADRDAACTDTDRSTNRRCAHGARALGLAATLLLILPSGASAAMSIDLTFPSESIVISSGGSPAPADYFTVTTQFPLVFESRVDDVLYLTLKDFFIPNPSLGFGYTYEFQIEDPNTPGSYAVKQDIPITWDTAFDTGGGVLVGRIQSEVVRARLTLTVGNTPETSFTSTSFFDLVLTTDPAQTGSFSCPQGNFTDGRFGTDLPPGVGAADGAALGLVAGTCPDTGASLNELPDTIVMVDIDGTLTVATVPALGEWGMLSLLLLLAGAGSAALLRNREGLG